MERGKNKTSRWGGTRGDVGEDEGRKCLMTRCLVGMVGFVGCFWNPFSCEAYHIMVRHRIGSELVESGMLSNVDPRWKVGKRTRSVGPTESLRRFQCRRLSLFCFWMLHPLLFLLEVSP